RCELRSTLVAVEHRCVHGLMEQDLFDPCVNVLVAAWILSHNFARLGYNTQGLGAYNAVTPWKRELYARQILQTIKY
ncbi:MAG: hypothetical protein EBW49_00915, partial [Betaproteobacteria bacterium]|nr:hypothetical protein [Betaproteobacteria bacterium]